jgi:hypothetical protein
MNDGVDITVNASSMQKAVEYIHRRMRKENYPYRIESVEHVGYDAYNAYIAIDNGDDSVIVNGREIASRKGGVITIALNGYAPITEQNELNDWLGRRGVNCSVGIQGWDIVFTFNGTSHVCNYGVVTIEGGSISFTYSGVAQ